MAFSSGTFSRLYSWAADKLAGTKIRADRMDAEMDGFATGLSTCILKDGTQTITAAIPFNSQNITGVGDFGGATATLTGAISGATVTGAMVATQANQETSTSTATIVTPGRQQYHPSAAKGWINFSPAGATQASYNVTSLTDSGVGDFNIIWNVDFSSVHYCALVSIDYSLFNGGIYPAIGTITASNTQCVSTDNTGTHSETGISGYHCVVLGDQ